MSANKNPFASAAGGYATTVSFDAPAAPDRGQLIKDTTTTAFATDVIKESRQQPVLVDFWAPWCGPCRQLTPVLEKAVLEAAGAVKLVKMNIDEHPAIAGQLGVQSIPAVIAFSDGQPLDGFMGAVPESQVKDFIKRLAGKNDLITEALDEARQAVEQGDLENATAIYSAILERAPDNADAIAGLGAILLDAGDEDAVNVLLDEAPPAALDQPALAGLKARIALVQEVRGLGDPAELERRLQADPKDHGARFEMAMIQNARGERMEAAESLLSIVKADRTWRDDGARSQLLKFFEAWGMTDEATLAARRKLSSLLFS
jgi:putative thioredoxin